MSKTIRNVITVDLNRSPREQASVLHNRWHPDIPAAASVKPGEVFKVECCDWTGGQVKNDDSADDIRDINLNVCHYISGPVNVEGAQPGDYLEVEILEIQPFPGHEWGYTAIFDRNNGGGFLEDLYPHAAKAIWDFEGINASSRHIPGVRFAGLIHPGIVGTAPSHELLEKWNQREGALVASNPHRVSPVAHLPLPDGAQMGQLEKTDPGKAKETAKNGARTIPPREHGGNCDIKNLSRGSRVWLPVYVPGAKLSVGDLHFSEGDGEISFCGAIEMAGVITLKTKLIKGGMGAHGNLSMPVYMPGPVEPRYFKHLTFEGISVDATGTQHYLDATLSFREAILNCIAYLRRFGYSDEQVYLLLSAAPVEGRINAIVDVPNACCSIGIPTEIFEFDITPKTGGHGKVVSASFPKAKPV